MPVTTLRYSGTCVRCGMPLPAGSRAFFDPTNRRVSCAGHHRAPGPGPGPISARRFAQDVAAAHRDRVRGRWGPLAPLVLAFSAPDPQVAAARKGAVGEERVGAFLDRTADRSHGRLRVLHDRRIPGRRENLDHVVVCPSGVWAVDAKAYAGRIRVNLSGSRLSMGRRDGEPLLAQVQRQQRFLTASFTRLGLPQLPVDGALCFVDGDMAWWTNGRRAGGVLVASPRRLRRELLAPGPLTVPQVAWVADRLDGWFTRQ